MPTLDNLNDINPFTDFTRTLLNFKSIAADSLLDPMSQEKDTLKLFLYQRIVNSINDIESMLHISENASLDDLRDYVKERKNEEDVLLRFLILRELF